MRASAEHWLEADRDQLVLWLPVAMGAGIAAWFVLPDARGWAIAMLAALAIAAGALAGARGGRGGVVVAVACVAFALGLSLVWWRTERVVAPVLSHAMIVRFEADVASAQPLPARGLLRLRLTDIRWDAPVPDPAPTAIRVNLATADVPPGLGPGARIAMRARLMPPADPAVPGAYDFARVAWFDGLGATGRGLAPVSVVRAGRAENGLRERLTAHIHERLPGSAGGIAAALATGDVGGISDDDSEAMRDAGLAHLLSVSGLHITAAVALVMLVFKRVLALSPWLALTGRVPLLAAAAGALAAIGYTWLTGAQVPTIRSCVAALMVLAALAAGREAITLRLVAVGALVVMVAWPETIAGPSFQLSFAAITAIVALHEHPGVARWFLARDEPWWRKRCRDLASLLLTGVAVEVALMPIAVFHFHQAGLYGALANIVAIPLTTFVVMPVEAVALALDSVGWGAPAWWVAGQGLVLLLRIARGVAGMPGAVTALPAMPAGAFALLVGGGLWAALWRTRWRRLGVLPIMFGAGWALATPVPDLLVTGDGRHLAIRDGSGGLAILRDRSGDYVRDTLAENGGLEGEPMLLSDSPLARCNRDLCWITRRAGGRDWHVLATRSLHLVPAGELIPLCRRADIVVSERRVPRRCRARWLTLDRPTLARTGGVAVTLSTGDVATVRRAGDTHPWIAIRNSGAGYRPAYPAREPARGRNAAGRRRDWQDRAGSSPLRDGST
jgi:competence protein ComEC